MIIYGFGLYSSLVSFGWDATNKLLRTFVIIFIFIFLKSTLDTTKKITKMTLINQVEYNKLKNLIKHYTPQTQSLTKSS